MSTFVATDIQSESSLTLSGATASRALTINASNQVVASATTDTELGFLSGVTSAVQTQLGSKEPTITAGTSSQYWRGDKTFQTLNQAAVAGLTTADIPTFAQVSVGTPTAASHAATKSYVDTFVQGITSKEASRVATIAALPAVTYNNGTSGVGATLTASANGALTIDGVAVSAGDVVLIKNQASAFQNGIYVVTNAGGVSAQFVLTRSVDMDAVGPANEFTGGYTYVQQGTLAGTGWVCTSSSSGFTVGTSAVNFTQFNGAGTYTADGTTITLSGNVFSVATGGITNTQISASAAIAYSKLALTNSIVNADISSSAAIAYSKLSLAASIANSDLTNMTQATIKGRAAGGGTGSPQDLTAAQVLTILGIGGARIIKSGTVAGSSFAGNPKTAAVAFGTAFPNTSYQIIILSDTNRAWTWSSKATSGFTINANANQGFAAGHVDWFAISTGETTE